MLEHGKPPAEPLVSIANRLIRVFGCEQRVVQHFSDLLLRRILIEVGQRQEGVDSAKIVEQLVPFSRLIYCTQSYIEGQPSAFSTLVRVAVKKQKATRSYHS